MSLTNVLTLPTYGIPLPRSLRRQGSQGTGRDSRGNIMVHGSTKPVAGVTALPSDSSIRWMYISSTGAWVEGYR